MAHGEDIHRPNLFDRYCNPSLTRIVPYGDGYLDLSYNPYDNIDEPVTKVDEGALERFIDRLLVNQAIALINGKEYHEDFESNPLDYHPEKIPDMYKVQSKAFCDGRLPRKRSSSRNHRRTRSRRSSELDESYRDLPEGSKLSFRDGEPTITLTVDMLRRYLYTEVEARVRFINQFYERQWEAINKEKLQSYYELIEEKKQNADLRKQLDLQNTLNSHYKTFIRDLKEKVSTTQDAKRRRRQARKQRKCELPVTSQSDTRASGHSNTEILSQENKASSSHSEYGVEITALEAENVAVNDEQVADTTVGVEKDGNETRETDAGNEETVSLATEKEEMTSRTVGTDDAGVGREDVKS